MADITISVDSTQVVRARQELKQTATQALETLRATKKLTSEDRLTQHFAAIDRQISKTNAAMAQASRRFSASQKGARNFEVGLQQAGYQIGDFAVQVQSGTNPLVAFSQQFSQLVGFMGPWGAALGAVAAIVAGFGVYFMKASEDVGELQNAMEELTKSTRTAKDELFALQMGYESATQGAVLKQIIALEVEASRLRQEAMLEEGLVAQDRANQAIALEQEAQKLRETLQEQKDVEQEILDIKELQEERTKRIYDLFIKTISLDLGSVFRSAEPFAQSLVDKVTDLYTKMAALAYLSRNQAGGVTSGGGIDYLKSQYSMYGGGQQASRNALIEAGPLYTPFPVPDKKSSRGGSKAKEQEDALQKLREQLALENELLGVSEAQERVIRALGDQRGKYSETEIKAITAEVEAYNQKLKVLEEQKQLAETFKSSMETAFMSVVEGTESAKDAFKSMAYEMIKELYRVLVVQRMVGSFNMGTGQGSGIIGGIAGLLGFRESGGSVMANRPYIVGERGPELVIPRHSGTVMNANQTSGVLSGNGDITVQNNITVTGSDAAMVRAEVAKMIPQITNATKAAVIDAKQRGGQMSAAFR